MSFDKCLCQHIPSHSKTGNLPSPRGFPIPLVGGFVLPDPGNRFLVSVGTNVLQNLVRRHPCSPSAFLLCEPQTHPYHWLVTAAGVSLRIGLLHFPFTLLMAGIWVVSSLGPFYLKLRSIFLWICRYCFFAFGQGSGREAAGPSSKDTAGFTSTREAGHEMTRQARGREGVWRPRLDSPALPRRRSVTKGTGRWGRVPLGRLLPRCQAHSQARHTGFHGTTNPSVERRDRGESFADGHTVFCLDTEFASWISQLPASHVIQVSRELQ